ncbi:MAG: pilus assembly protein PilM [Planctomycetota bacterium]
MRWMMSRPGPIGLDIGSDTVKAAQLIRNGEGFSAHALASFARREPGAPLSAREAVGIADVLRRRGFVGSRVALSAPEESVVRGLLDLPLKSTEESRERIVRMEIARVHRLPADSFTCCWSQLPAPTYNTGQQQALCWALTHASIDPVLSSLDSAGLKVAAIEPMSAALSRSCASHIPDWTRISAIADLGASSVRVILLYQGRVVHERRLTEWSGAKIADALSEKWSAPRPVAQRAMQRYGVERGGTAGVLASETAGTIAGVFDEMIEQITLSFSFVSHQYPDAELGPLLLTGGVAGMPGLAGLLAQALQLEVVPVAPAALLSDCPQGDAASSSAAVAAVGLAMQEEGRHG